MDSQRGKLTLQEIADSLVDTLFRLRSLAITAQYAAPRLNGEDMEGLCASMFTMAHDALMLLETNEGAFGRTPEIAHD